jgi:VanZ family protein
MKTLKKLYKSIFNTVKHFDKFLHLIVGFISTLIFSFITCAGMALGLTIVMGITKEVYDYYSPSNKVEFLDWLATVIGALLAFIIII